jgi:DNA-binding response OmpR family regulator
MLAEQPAPESRETAFRVANLEVRPAELQVLAGERRAGFTVREFELFFLLSQRIDTVVQRPEIYTLMWGGEMPRRNRSVDVLVRKVRAKLERIAPDWRYVHTHFGIGYRFMPERAVDSSGEPSKTAAPKPSTVGSTASSGGSSPNSS